VSSILEFHNFFRRGCFLVFDVRLGTFSFLCFDGLELLSLGHLKFFTESTVFKEDILAVAHLLLKLELSLGQVFLGLSQHFFVTLD